MLLLVFAGTRGARDGLMNLFSKSDFARKFAITQGLNRPDTPTASQTPPERATKGVGVDRMERISEKLNKDWERKIWR